MLSPSIECERARRAASLAADGEISELERASLHAHLAACPACAAYAAGVDGLTASLRAAPLELPARPLFEAAPTRRRVAQRRIVRVAAAAAAVVAALGAGHYAGSLSSPSNGQHVSRAAIAATQEPYREQTILALLGRPASWPHGRTQAV
jgi:anti-sigma factor RsiW